MDSTSISLLRRLGSGECEIAWERFVELYAPLIFFWGRGRGLSPTDSADLVQDVLTILVTKLPEFQYDSKLRFRGWLRTITVNRANDIHRRNAIRPRVDAGATLGSLAETGELDLFEQVEYRKYVVARAMKLMKSEFAEHHWRACWLLVVDGLSGKEIAAQLEMTESAVYVAKCRILKRLREELDGLVDEPE